MALVELEQARHEQNLRDQLNHIDTWEGPKVGDNLKYYNIRPQDAKRGNLVLFDVREREEGQQGNDDLFFGQWDKCYEVGVVKKTIKTSGDGTETTDNSEWKLMCEMYEPWTPDSQGIPLEPVWVTIEKTKASNARCQRLGLETQPLPEDNWETVVKYPWCAIRHIPITLLQAIDPGYTWNAKQLIYDYRGSGKNVLYLGAGKCWEYPLPLANTRYVCHRDKSEVGKSKVMKWTEDTQARILGEIRRTEQSHRPWEAPNVEDETSSDS